MFYQAKAIIRFSMLSLIFAGFCSAKENKNSKIKSAILKIYDADNNGELDDKEQAEI